jgi:hypothetical protein
MLSLEELYAEVCNTVNNVFKHCPTICEMASKCQHVTELGLNSFGVTVSLLAAQPNKLICYGENDTQVKNIVERVGAVTGKTDFRTYVGNSLEIQIAETDMLIIDTFHSYSQAKAELQRHAGDVKRYLVFPSSYAFSTRGEDGHSPGISQAIHEFIEENPVWSVIYNVTQNNGMTILEREPTTGSDFERLYSMVTYDIPDVRWIERYTMGMKHPNQDFTATEIEEISKKQCDELNRSLRYGIIIGVERNFTIITIDDKEVRLGYLVYHVGFRHRPIGR